MRKKVMFWPLAAFACFLALRLLVLWTGVERTGHYDELDLGTMAKEFLQGLKLPYADYQLDFYSGESLVLGAMVIPFFKWMGMNLMAIKMVPLLFSCVTFWLVWIFLRRNFGEKAGAAGVWLLAFCPQGFVQLSLCGMSGHTEALAFSIGAAAAFYEYLFHGRRKRFLWAFGFLSGFGFWFYYACGIMTAACLLTWLLIDGKVFWKKIPAFSLAFAAGFSPWFLFNLQHLEQGIRFFAFGASYHPYGPPAAHALKKILKLFLIHIPMAFAVEPSFGIRPAFWGYAWWLLAFVPVFVWSYFPKKDPKFLLPGLYWICFVLAFGLLQFDLRPDFGFVGFRYLTPLLFWSLVFFAVLISQAGRRPLIWLLAALMVGLGSQRGIAFQEKSGRALLYKGYSYYQLAIRWQFSLVRKIHGFEDVRNLFSKFPPVERDYLYWGLSDAGVFMGEPELFEKRVPFREFLKYGMEDKYPFLMEWFGAASTSDRIEDLAAPLEVVPPALRGYFFKGWFEWSLYDRKLPGCGACKAAVPADGRRWAYFGLGRKLYYDMLDPLYSVYWQDPYYLFFSDMKKKDLDFVFGKLAQLAPDEKRWAYEGIGRSRLVDGIYANRLMIPAFETFLKKVPQENRADVYRGLGWGIREMLKEDALRVRDWIESLPPEGRAPAMEGMKEYESWYRVPEK